METQEPQSVEFGPPTATVAQSQFAARVVGLLLLTLPAMLAGYVYSERGAYLLYEAIFYETSYTSHGWILLAIAAMLLGALIVGFMAPLTWGLILRWRSAEPADAAPGLRGALTVVTARQMQITCLLYIVLILIEPFASWAMSAAPFGEYAFAGYALVGYISAAVIVGYVTLLGWVILRVIARRRAQFADAAIPPSETLAHRLAHAQYELNAMSSSLGRTFVSVSALVDLNDSGLSIGWLLFPAVYFL